MSGKIVAKRKQDWHVSPSQTQPPNAPPMCKKRKIMGRLRPTGHKSMHLHKGQMRDTVIKTQRNQPPSRNEKLNSENGLLDTWFDKVHFDAEHKLKKPVHEKGIKDAFYAAKYAACIAVAAALFAMTTAIVLGAGQVWLAVLATVFLGSYFQRRTNGVVKDEDIRNAYLSMMSVFTAQAFRNVKRVHKFDFMWFHGMLAAGTLSLWFFATNSTTQQRALVWVGRGYVLATALVMSVADSGKIGVYLAQEGNVSLFLSTIGLGLPFYWLRVSHVEFMWHTTTLMAVITPFWIFASDAVDMSRVVVFNALILSASVLAFVVASDRRFRILSKEWMYASATENVFGIFVTVTCFALHCHLTSCMLLFALLLTWSCAIAALVIKHSHHKKSPPKPQAFEAETDEVLAIRRFQLSSKPFIAFTAIGVVFETVIVTCYPSMQLPMVAAMIVHLVTGTFRCYFVNSDDQGRVRWLFGWLWVGVAVFDAIMKSLTWSTNAKLDYKFLMVMPVMCTVGYAFLNICGIPGPCRMVSLLVWSTMAYVVEWTIDYHALSTAAVVGGLLFGEVVGRLCVQRARPSATEEAAASKYFQSSSKHFLGFSAIFILLELYLAVSRPNLAGLCDVCITMHFVTVGGRWYLRGAADQSLARWLFGCGWATVLICMVAAFAFAQQQHYQFDSVVVWTGAAMWLLTFIDLNMIGAPWLARWALLCFMIVVPFSVPSYMADKCLYFLGAMILGEVVGQFRVKWHQLAFPSLPGIPIKFEEQAKERRYITKHFNDSYSTILFLCVAIMLLSCVAASYFPQDDMRSSSLLLNLLFWLGILSFRVHTERTVRHADKPAYFGFGMVIITLLFNIILRTLQVKSIIVDIFFKAILIITGKVICLPERHRQAINIIILASFVPVWPVLADVTKLALFEAVIATELAAFTFDQKRRASHQAADGLRRELASRKAQMTFAMDASASPACIADDHMDIVCANRAALMMFEYTEQELVGQHMGILMMPSIAKKLGEFVKEFRRTGVSSIIGGDGWEVQGRRKDGHTLDLFLTLNTSSDRMLFSASFRDLSVKKGHQKRQRHMDLALNTTLSIAMFNSDLRFTYVNEAMCSTFGYTEDELVGEYIGMCMNSATQAEHKEFVDAFHDVETDKKLKIVGREAQGKHKDGRTLHLLLNLNVTDDRNFFVASYQDLSAEVNLREAKATVATFENVPGVFLVTTDTESHLDVDGDFLGVTGYTADEFVALDPFRDFLSPKADRAQVVSAFATMSEPDESFVEVNLPYVHKDGHTIWLRACHGSRVIGTTSNGKHKFMVVFSDVTAAVLAQRELRVARDGLINHMEWLPAMVYALIAGDSTRTRRLAYVNSGCKSIYGLTPSEMKFSNKWMGMVHPDDVELFEASISESQERMQPWDVEFRVVVNNVIKYLHSRARPRLEDSNVVWTGILQDVTANRNLREKTKKDDVQKEIAGRLKAACTFLSHEIRNQLYPQNVVFEDMREEEPKWRDSIDMMLGANTTVNNILNRVVDLAKWESGEFPTDTTLFSVVRLFNAIAADAQANGASVGGLARVEPTWHVRADEHLLKQAVNNLVLNASKFSNGKPVSVDVAFERTNRAKGVIVVKVTDQGRGMTADQLTKVMVPFGQIRKAGEVESGTGLGLPLTKAMVETGHKGSLMLASEGLGKGTIATMRVPVEWVEQREKPRKESDPLSWVAPHPGATADILVVDDVKLNRMVTIFAAKKLGLTFHEASDGAEAVDLLRKNTYSMVFMDRQMPVMDGFAATEKARANGYTLPIIMTSGDTFEPSVVTEMHRRGVTAFLGKMAIPGTRHAMKKLKQMKQKR